MESFLGSLDSDGAGEGRPLRCSGCPLYSMTYVMLPRRSTGVQGSEFGPHLRFTAHVGSFFHIHIVITSSDM